MCGIAGVFSRSEQVDRRELAKAMDALRHRGPDGEGSWVSGDRRAGLAHTRLAIIGLSDGAQPISNETGDVHIVVNGEFYGFEQIRIQLEAQGHHFRTHTDSEIALHLYEQYGLDCLAHLRGEFSFIIYDETARRLFAARDRFGVKPLVYAMVGGDLYLASEAKALFAMGVPAAWDSESFYHAASMQYTLPHRTLFSGVNQLSPGHFLLADDGGVKTTCYWDLDYAAAEQPREETEAIEQLRFHLEDAVRVRMRADIPVCFHLSGGLDSATILGLAASHATGPLDCFTVSFSESSYDELAIAQEMASRVGANLHPVSISQAQIIEHLSDAVYFCEGLAVNGHLPAKYLLHKAISASGFKVALTGEGSDELFCGYAHLRDDLYTAQGSQHLLSDLYGTNRASAGIMLKHGAALPLNAVQAKLGYIPSFLQAKASLGFKMHSVLNAELLQSRRSVDAYHDLLACFDLPGQLQNRHPVYQSLYLWCKTALANYILRSLGDGTELASAVEGRVPFLDHLLFEFARSLPLQLKINGSIEKYVLRESARSVVTDTVYRRQKHPFVAPPLSVFSDRHCQTVLQDSLRSDAFQSLPFFDHQQLVALLDRIHKLGNNESSAWDPVLMMALSCAALQERFQLKEAV